MRLRSARMLGSALLAMVLAAAAQAAPVALPSGKKLIEWGWDEPGPAFMKANAARMDRLGFDGVIFHAEAVRDGKGMNFTWECWGSRRFEYSDFARSLADLQACRFTRLTDNFVRFNVCPGDVDWFDEQAFAVVLNNAECAARFAREGGCRGWMFDVEMYGKRLFSYQAQAHKDTHSFADYEAIVRRRGRQFIQAINRHYPDITLLLTYAYSITGSDAGRSKLEYGLLKSFLDGMFEAAAPQTSIVDAWEGAYSYRKRSQFEAAYQSIHHKLARVSAVPDAYRKHIRAGFGIWMDMNFRRYGWHTHAEDFDANYFLPAEFAYSVHSALRVTDKYVWVYTEKPLWWTNVRVPLAYRAALRKARLPHEDLDARMGQRAIMGDTGTPASAIPQAANQPGYDDESTFGDLKPKYDFLADLPKTWQFTTDPTNQGTTGKWYAPGFDASKWTSLEIGKFWDEQGVQFCGNAWYRLTWDTPTFPAPPGKAVVLLFGAADETALVWVNGQLAGKHDEGADYGWDKRFLIPVTGKLKPGEKNVIVVKVGNSALAGGLWKSVKLAVAR